MTDICPKAYFSSPDQWQPVGQELLWTEGGGLHAEIAQSVLTVIFQVPGSFVPISLQPILRTMAAHVLGTVGSSYS